MADLTAAEKKQKLLDSGPQQKDYTKVISVKTGSTPKGRPITKDQVVPDPEAYQKALGPWLLMNKRTLDSLDEQIGQETTQGGIKTKSAKDVSDYLGGDIHKWYETHGGREAFGVGALGGYGLGRLTLPVATPGAGWLNRLRIMGMAGGEAALGPAAEWLVSGSGPDNPHGQDVDRMYGNAGLGESFGAGAAGLFKMSHGAFGAAPGTPATKAPPALTTGMKGTPATEALADYLGTSKGKTRADTWKGVSPALKAADEATIRGLAKGMPAAELGGLSPEKADIFALRDKVLTAAERWGTKTGAAANVKAIAPEALGLPLMAGQAVAETMFPGGMDELTYQASHAIPPETRAAIGKYTDIAGPVARGLESLNAQLPGHLSKEEKEARAAAWERAQAEHATKAEEGEQARMGPIYSSLQQQFPPVADDEFRAHLDQLGSHLDNMKARYGGAPASPGAKPPMPTGGGMPGLTGVPGAAPVGPNATALHPSTAAMLEAMMRGRQQGNAAALMGIGQ